VQEGLYRWVRHPSYLGALIAFLGFALALGNWWSVAVFALVTPAAYLFRIREEDAALAAALGEPYRDYCRRTKRLIPGVY
jgi:protein-S-isoprenylcysteine O-methyltransferase